MITKLQPDLYYRNIFVIDFDKLKQEGIKGIICDIDNTIVPWTEEEVIEEVADWFISIKDKGFDICLVSNGTDRRVQFFSDKLSLPAFGQAIKPTKRAFKLAQKSLDFKKTEIAVIGDQIFTDVFGGNRMGYKTILVDPMSKKEFITTKIMRLLEKIFFKRREET
ncbi:MAG: YqeG family HAD IIIA-type phosphatase [Halanaerobiales bacterium]